ncbi:MAG: hypothetical protein HY722_01960 [Planctomycetes bacterium]|nr:hypothetical protein [Planctomycetota bacterium]
MRTRTRRGRRDGGLGQLEVLIAMAVSSLVVAALSTAVTAGLGAWDEGSRRNAAWLDAAAALDRVAGAVRSAEDALPDPDGTALALALPGGARRDYRLVDGRLQEDDGAAVLPLAAVAAADFRVVGDTVEVVLGFQDGGVLRAVARMRGRP